MSLSLQSATGATTGIISNTRTYGQMWPRLKIWENYTIKISLIFYRRIVKTWNTFLLYSQYLFYYDFDTIIGCKHSYVYGTACDIPCPAACKGTTCHIQSGACRECEHGVYGNFCNFSCPTNCEHNVCHKQNGTCLICKPGWTGIYCNTSKNMYHIFHKK